jgi:predicted RNase H-like HicB family nuclease
MIVPTIVLTEVVYPEDDLFVSHCPELDIASCGATAQEAYEKIQEAIALYLNTLEEMGLREQVFAACGIGITHERVEEYPDAVVLERSLRLSQSPGVSILGTQGQTTACYSVPSVAATSLGLLPALARSVSAAGSLAR